MLKMWILILHQTSEQLWTEDEQANIVPGLSTFDEDSLKEVSLEGFLDTSLLILPS